MFILPSHSLLPCACWQVTTSIRLTGCEVCQRHIDSSFPLNKEHRQIMKVTICSPQPPQGRDLMTRGGDGTTRWRWEVGYEKAASCPDITPPDLPSANTNPPLRDSPGWQARLVKSSLHDWSRRLVSSPDPQHHFIRITTEFNAI